MEHGPFKIIDVTDPGGLSCPYPPPQQPSVWIPWIVMERGIYDAMQECKARKVNCGCVYSVYIFARFIDRAVAMT